MTNQLPSNDQVLTLNHDQAELVEFISSSCQKSCDTVYSALKDRPLVIVSASVGIGIILLASLFFRIKATPIQIG